MKPVQNLQQNEWNISNLLQLSTQQTITDLIQIKLFQQTFPETVDN